MIKVGKKVNSDKHFDTEGVVRYVCALTKSKYLSINSRKLSTSQGECRGPFFRPEGSGIRNNTQS
jgi:hypothetical protein